MPLNNDSSTTAGRDGRPCDPACFTVGEWARDVVNTWWRTPWETPDGRPNPERATASTAASGALRTVAAHLRVRLADIGPCARCHAYHHRYGRGGQPLCPKCRAARGGGAA